MNLLSVIIPAHNEEQEIEAAVASVHEASQGQNCEIIVVCDTCTDRTAELASRAEAVIETVNLRQISAVRNAGARRAQGDVFIFMDADTRANPEVFAALLEALKRGAVGGGAGFTFDSDVTVFGRCLEWFFRTFCRWAKLAAGCFMFCSRESFEQTPGFSEDVFASEEWYFSRELKKVGTFVILKESVVTSSRKFRTFSPWQMLKQSLLMFKNPQRRSPLWYD